MTFDMKQVETPMGVKITEHDNSTIVDFGDSVRIERRFQQEADGGHKWVVYQRTKVKDGAHPVHGKATTETHVWTIAGEGTEEEARALARKLAG